MNKLPMQTPDLTEKNIEKIAALFPQVVTEAVDEAHSSPDRKVMKKAIDFEKLRQVLSPEALAGDEAYDFTWVGKKDAMVEAARPIRKTLRPVKEDSENWDTTENLYIEGDNLDALKLLQESYLSRVKMIYIDPPYNTGNDFVYMDNFTKSREEYEEEAGVYDEDGDRLFRNTDSNGRFHSDWCSMIYPRLVLARGLLRDDGVIFISIDDGELDSLKKVCDEVFGASNFRNIILTRRRVKSLNSQFASNGLYSMNVGFEYVLVYAKTPNYLMKALRMKKDNIPTKGRWDVFWSNADRPTMRYDVLGFTPLTGQWRNSKEKADIAVANYQKYETEFEDKMTLEEYSDIAGITDFIRRIPNGIGKNGGVQHWIAPLDTSLRTSNWTDIEVSQIGKEIDLPFDNPKSKTLIMELVKLADCQNGDIILDYFSGSATTAHAVIQLNAEDGGKRKYIMVQLPELTDEASEAYKAGYTDICEIGKERIRRAGEKIKSDLTRENAQLKLGEESKPIPDIGFRVLCIDSTNMKDVYYSPADTTQDLLSGLTSNIKEDRTPDDLLFGCLVDWGLPLSLPYTDENIEGCRVLTYNEGDLVACFDDDVPEALIRTLARRNPLRVVFRDSSFSDSPAKINVTEIFKVLSPSTEIRVL